MGELRVLRCQPGIASARRMATEIMVETRTRLGLSHAGMASRLAAELDEPVTAAQVRAYENPRCVPPGDVLMASLLILADCLNRLVS